MKKIGTIGFSLFIILLLCPNLVMATNESISTEEVLKEQQTELGISDFLHTSEKYLKDTGEEINVQEIFKSALQGSAKNTNLWNLFLTTLGIEIKEAIHSIGIILVIIIL